MVTANVTDLADEFDTIINERDFTSIGVVGLAGAGGGVITTQIVNRVAPMIGLSPSPSQPRELFGVGLLKMVLGAAMGYAGIKVGGSAGTLLAIAGLGTLVLGGGDWFNTLMTAGGSTTASMARAQGRQVTSNRSSGNVSARVVSNGSSSGGSSTSNATSVRDGGETDAVDMLLG